MLEINKKETGEISEDRREMLRELSEDGGEIDESCHPMLLLQQ